MQNVLAENIHGFTVVLKLSHISGETSMAFTVVMTIEPATIPVDTTVNWEDVMTNASRGISTGEWKIHMLGRWPPLLLCC